VWVPDVNRPGFAEEVSGIRHIINGSDQREDIMDWIESVSVDWDDNEPAET